MDDCKDANIVKVLASLKLSLSKTTTIAGATVAQSGAVASLSSSQVLRANSSPKVTATRAATQLKSTLGNLSKKYLKAKVASQDVKELPALELVVELTALEQELYEPIVPVDLVLWVVTRPDDREVKVPRLYKFMDRCLETTTWVASTIVCEPEVQERAACLLKFASMAKVRIHYYPFQYTDG